MAMITVWLLLMICFISGWVFIIGGTIDYINETMIGLGILLIVESVVVAIGVLSAA